MTLGGPIKFNEKGQVEGIGSACVQNLNLTPTVVLPANAANAGEEALATLVSPAAAKADARVGTSCPTFSWADPAPPREHEIVVYEVPLLFEGNLHKWLRPVVLVACDTDVQRQRLQKRDRLEPEEAQKHIDAQMSLEEKRRLADYVIENDGDLESLERQVEAVLKRIKTT